jgi:Amidohydrolase/Cysteine-rich domain
VRMALFVTCVNDALYPDIGKSAVTLLRRLKCNAGFPAGQTCCGQMHFNSAGVGETPEMLAAAAADPLVARVVGWTDLTSPAVADELARLRSGAGGSYLVSISAKPPAFVPFADVILTAFGPGRIMFGSDWPVCLLASDYAGVVDLARTLVAGLSDAERAAVFASTAARVYGIGKPARRAGGDQESGGGSWR